MKVNRRSFFGVAAAAPVAAKQAVTSVLEYEKASQLANIGSMSGASASVPTAAPTEWMHEELKSLIARKSRVRSGREGKYARGDKNALAAYIQIDNRRATSPAVKALLIAEERARRDEAMELTYLDEQIEHLKEKLGPLAMIFEGGE